VGKEPDHTTAKSLVLFDTLNTLWCQPAELFHKYVLEIHCPQNGPHFTFYRAEATNAILSIWPASLGSCHYADIA
jgi:hypothetical protein